MIMVNLVPGQPSNSTAAVIARQMADGEALEHDLTTRWHANSAAEGGSVGDLVAEITDPAAIGLHRRPTLADVPAEVPEGY